LHKLVILDGQEPANCSTVEQDNQYQVVFITFLYYMLFSTFTLLL